VRHRLKTPKRTRSQCVGRENIHTTPCSGIYQTRQRVAVRCRVLQLHIRWHSPVLHSVVVCWRHICINMYIYAYIYARNHGVEYVRLFGMTHSYGIFLLHMRHASFIWNMTHSCETWLIHMKHDLFIWDMTYSSRYDSPMWKIEVDFLTLYAHLQSGKTARIFKSIRWIACMLSFCKWEGKKRSEKKKYDSEKKQQSRIIHSVACMHSFWLWEEIKRIEENKYSREKAKKFQENLLAGSVSDSEERNRGFQDRHDQNLQEILIVLISFCLFWYILMIFTWNTHLYINTYENWNVNTYMKYSSIYIYMKYSSIYIYNWNLNTYMRSSFMNIYIYIYLHEILIYTYIHPYLHFSLWQGIIHMLGACEWGTTHLIGRVAAIYACHAWKSDGMYEKKMSCMKKRCHI